MKTSRMLGIFMLILPISFFIRDIILQYGIFETVVGLLIILVFVMWLFGAFYLIDRDD